MEKCLKLGGAGLNEQRDAVVAELMTSPNLGRLLQDPYANYVMQSALTVSSGQLHRCAAHAWVGQGASVAGVFLSGLPALLARTIWLA